MKSICSTYFILLYFIFGYTTLMAQRNNINTYNVLTINFSYGIHQPAGDLSDRFGQNFSTGGGIDFITEKKNLIFGLKGNNLFGSNVKEDPILSIRDSDGLVLGTLDAGSINYANVAVRERGFYFGGHVGKLFPLLKKNKRAGIRATFGAGLLQHKFRIIDENDNAEQLKGDLIKGYDQLSNGLTLEQFFGYQQLDRKTGINFFAGIELTEAFTKNRRTVNFATQSQNTNNRIDILLGFRVGWSFTFYVGERAEDIQY